ncbi:hypothetical protein RB623_28870 [Mesorhizobium sp. LHD-90]|uniref:hypothetical protein n=1 Tax=Mesorhizobium sp. LHD-90 TaxID=3071414 RepID=UPI0027E169CD|nr:hypothetical protein [Mesorhizobium sp. LHD-90]MDQ6438085.1 hypothetical protein [Mesorhizobium sp. LHD-90]
MTGPEVDPKAVAAARTICEAIERMRVLSFLYEGEERTADPYILGTNRKGILVLSAVQRTGGSGKGFRSFHLKGLSSLRIMEQKFFGSHPDYNPKDRDFEKILCQVKPRG